MVSLELPHLVLLVENGAERGGRVRQGLLHVLVLNLLAVHGFRALRAGVGLAGLNHLVGLLCQRVDLLLMLIVGFCQRLSSFFPVYKYDCSVNVHNNRQILYNI